MEKGVLRGHFYRAAMAVNSVAAGYVVAGEYGAILTAGLFTINALEEKQKDDAKRGFVPPNSYALLDPASSFVTLVEQVKAEMRIKEKSELIVTAGGQLSAIVGDPLRILIPEEDLEKYPPEELIHLLRHELAHQKISPRLGHVLNNAGKTVTQYLSWVGAALSVLTLNPLPAAAGFGSRLSHKLINTRMSQQAEYDCDGMAVRHGDGKKYLEVMRKVFYDNSHVILSAVSHWMAHNEQIPERIKRWMKGWTPPAFVQRLRQKIDHILSDTHPHPVDRLERIAKQVKAEDPDFIYDPHDHTETLNLCESCMAMKTEKQRAELRPYLAEAFREVYGHEKFEEHYYDCGSSKRRAVTFGIGVPGGVIIVMTGNPQDITDLSGIFGAADEGMPLPGGYPFPGSAGRGKTQEQDNRNRNERPKKKRRHGGRGNRNHFMSDFADDGAAEDLSPDF